MNAIETLKAYCEHKGWKCANDKRLLLEVLDEAKVLDEERDDSRWWTNVFRVVEVDGILYQYASAETTGDDSPTDKGWDFDIDSIKFARATRSVKRIATFTFSNSDEPFAFASLSSRPPYQMRVVDEKDCLDEDIRKLTAFIDSPKSMEAPDRPLLVEQLIVMKHYSQVLKDRIAGFDATNP